MVEDNATEHTAKSLATLKAEDTSKTALELTTETVTGEAADSILAFDMTADLFKNLKYTTIDASGVKAENKFHLNITGNDNITSILGGGGNDTLTATSTVGAVLDGGTGNDLLIGGGGADSFFFSAAGNGSDSIQGYSTLDVVSLGSGLTAPTSFDNVSYAGRDYVVSLGGSTTDSLTFESTGKFVLKQADGNTVSYAQSSIVSGDGVTIGNRYYTSKTFNGNSDANADFVTIDASAVEHAIRVTGNDKLNYIVGSKFGGTLLGGDGADSLVASSVGTFLNGGDGADSLVGYDGGGNTFIYTGGADSIKNYTQDKDLVSVASGVNVAAASVTTASGNLIIDFDGEKLTFEGGGVSTISLKSGRRDYLFSANSIASGNSITLTAGYAASSFEGGSTYDTIDASAVSLASGGISITGNDNGNYIAIGKSGGSLFGGSGNDTLVGGDKEDIFRYTAGKDVIQNFGTGDSLTIDDTAIAKARSSSRRLTFTMTDKNNTLVFRSDDSIPAQISLTSGGYLTKDGVVKDTAKSLKLFSSAKGRIDLNDTLYSAASIETADASAVKSQSVTLVGGSQGGAFTFATDGNKKRDGFEYGGGSVSISNYESGRDRINLGDYSISAFTVNDSSSLVAMSLSNGSTDGFISLTSAAGSEVMIHQNSVNRGNSYSKMVFDKTGVVYDKAASKATNATIWGGMTENETYTAANKVKKITLRGDVEKIAIQAGGNNTVIDASAAGAGISLYSGAKNDKFTGSANADMFVYTAGKDILQDFDATDLISLNGGSDINLNDAKITASKKSIKFKFGTKDVLTVKPTKGDTLSGELTINGDTRTYGKNSIADSNGNVTLTSKFGGTYNVSKSGGSTIDGGLVSKKLTFKGTDAAESILGGSGKTMFKGGGGADSLVGGTGADTFFYAKGDKGSVTIADFNFEKDKLKIAGGTLAKVSMTGSGVQFAMKEGRGESPEVGWFNLTTDANKVLIKANNTYYWFADGNETLASDDTLTANEGALVTSVNKISSSQTKGYDIIELNYSTNLVRSNVAVQVKDTLKSNG